MEDFFLSRKMQFVSRTMSSRWRSRRKALRWKKAEPPDR
jgi:hypothetical protein